MASVSDFLKIWRGSETFVEAHTSGSTGLPKTIRLPKSDMEVSARATCDFFDIGPDSVLGLPLSVDYIAGKMMVVRSEVSGARILEMPVSNDVAVTEDIDLLAVVPSQIPSLLAQADAAGRVRNLLIGGSPMPPELARKTIASGWNAFIGYGMTETCSHVALRRLDDPSEVYRAMPGVTFEAGRDGCLAVVAPHYSFRRLETRDIVTILSPTEMCWRGRADNVIISGGRKFFPEELEKTYAPLLEGRRFYVCGRPDEKWGQAVTVVMEGEPMESVPCLPFCKAVEYVPELPRTANGKIIRR